MEIIDAHVHFWDPALLEYAWLGEVPAIRDAHLPEHFSRDTESVGANRFTLSGLIFVEADCSPSQAMDEVDWVERLAREQEPRIRGVVAAAALEKGKASRPHLQALRQRPLVRGVRRLIQAEEPGFCTDPAFIEGVRLLPEFDLSFDLCLKHHQFAEVRSLVEVCPETAFILDHIGKPGIAHGMLDPWRWDIDRLAALPQVTGCKLSGLVTEADWDHWSPEDLKPYLGHVLEAFGPERLLFGSDWPVCRLAGGYPRWWDAFEAFIEGLAEDDRARILGGTAKRVYRL